jgi:hypothetical protein
VSTFVCDVIVCLHMYVTSCMCLPQSVNQSKAECAILVSLFFQLNLSAKVDLNSNEYNNLIMNQHERTQAHTKYCIVIFFNTSCKFLRCLSRDGGKCCRSVDQSISRSVETVENVGDLSCPYYTVNYHMQKPF